MSHLGQRLSALIDGELDESERERVLIHLSRCGSCRDEIAALRTLKRRMNALGEAAADAGLTGRLMGLRDAAGDGGRTRADWPQSATAGGWLATSHGRFDSKVGWYVLGSSVAAVLAGLGTAAFIAGGPQDHVPEPSITPSVDVYTVQHDFNAGWAPVGAPRLTGAQSSEGTAATGPGSQGVTGRVFRGSGITPRSIIPSYQR
jgi:anti-sigma factor RsiW